jgi:NitT/TauT family transport system substrate-binding protein
VEKYFADMTFARTRFLALGALLALAISVAGPVGAQTLTTVHVGGVITDDLTPVFYAEKAGYFKREGLDVQIVGATSGAAMAAAVLSGTYEFGKSSLLAAVNAHLRGLPLEVIAAGGTYDTKTQYAGVSVAPDSTMSTGKDFEGKTMGTPALNDLNQLVMSAWVDEHGGDYKTLKFVELPQSVSIGAIATHRVDAAVLLQPILADAIATKQVKVLGSAYDAIAPRFVFVAYFTSSDYAQKHPDIVAKFTRALYAAAAYTNKHHDETAAMMADATKMPLATISRMPRVDGATSLDPAEFQPIIDAAAKFHLIAHGFPAREMMENAPGLTK